MCIRDRNFRWGREGYLASLIFRHSSTFTASLISNADPTRNRGQPRGINASRFAANRRSGHLRRFECARATSASHLNPDISLRRTNRRFGPRATFRSRSDHPALEVHPRRARDALRPGRGKWRSKNFFLCRAEPFREQMIQLFRWPTGRGGFPYEHVRPFPKICR